MSKLAILALAVALCATAVAQSRVSMGRPAAGPVGMGGRHFGAGISVVERGHRHPFGRSPFFFLYGAPYFYSDDYEPYDLQYAKSEPAPQPVSSEANPGPLPEPVLLELHGSQWVKVTNFGETSQQALNPSSQSASAKPMPAAVLVYRDGHSEEMMYTKADYYSSGSWTRTIQIADLDIPATLKQNQQRGVKFDLPSGPDEVVIRP
ncbi:MAG: hypothetical protein DMG98_01325 [Acidobacteria bacterium]|nr:MAG: hypothetical protein DMG98_01325 [Acidobacteriota bacterium]